MWSQKTIKKNITLKLISFLLLTDISGKVNIIWCEAKIMKSDAKANLTIMRWALIVLIPHIVVYIILFPGFLQADHQSLIAHIAIGEPSQWHSLLWGYLFFPLIYLSSSFGLYGIAQTLIFVVCVIYSIKSLIDLNIIENKGAYVLAVVFGFAPTFLLYNELYASDIIFAYMLMPLTIQLIKLVLSHGVILKKISFDSSLIVLLFIVYELRKNAVLIPIFLFFILIFSYRIYWKRILSVFSIVSVCIIGANFFWSDVINATPSPSQEMLSVPAVQIGYVFAHDGDIPDDAYEYLTTIRSEKEWKDNYQFYSADKEKDSIELTPEFVKAWIEVGVNNPRAYLTAYVDLMHPYWQLVAASDGLNIGVDFLNQGFFADSVCKHKQCSEHFLSQFLEPWSVSRQWIEGIQGQILLQHWFILSDSLVLIFFNRAIPLWIFLIGFF